MECSNSLMSRTVHANGSRRQGVARVVQLRKHARDVMLNTRRIH